MRQACRVAEELETWSAIGQSENLKQLIANIPSSRSRVPATHLAVHLNQKSTLDGSAVWRDHPSQH